MHTTLARIALVAVALGCGATAFAGEELLDLDAGAVAKIAKEKVKAAALERKSEQQDKADGNTGQSASCGSQSIGNIDTGGRIGAAPREVFVFAPNAINIADRGSCR